MGKSAQFPLHVWLPDSMEGPTPISALIHAATMVTAGIFMVARMSPLYRAVARRRCRSCWSSARSPRCSWAWSALTQYDIKRVVAYSTLSQLGYMTAALGASAYSAAMFHLMTHAFFKALLFLAAGSVIIALHHEQDMRAHGRPAQVHADHLLDTADRRDLARPASRASPASSPRTRSSRRCTTRPSPGAGFAYFCVVACVFVTAFYTFRMVFMVFHGEARFDDRDHPPHESPRGGDGAAGAARHPFGGRPATGSAPVRVRRLLRRRARADAIRRWRISTASCAFIAARLHRRCRSGWRSPASPRPGTCT